MKITAIKVYKADLPYVGGEYRWGRGNAISIAKTSVVVVETDAGLSGCGEFCPCGENYMVAHFAASTPEEFLINSTDLHNYNTVSTGVGGPTVRDGRLFATDTLGLGVVPDLATLGAPVAVWGHSRA